MNINDPLHPRIVSRISLKHPRSVAIQLRYAFVVDDEGLKVIDVTQPEQARMVEGAFFRSATRMMFMSHARMRTSRTAKTESPS